MNKIIPIALTLGCIGVSAATSNYDLLGRKASKMNSPMVYKNVDYAKVQKNEQQKVGPSLETHSLQKTGMPSNVKAIAGAYRSLYMTNNRMVDGGFNTNANHFLRRYYVDKTDNCLGGYCNYNWAYYRSRLGAIFIRTEESREDNLTEYAGYMFSNSEPMTSQSTPGWTNANGHGYMVSFNSANGSTSQTSPYNSNQTISYKQYSYVKNTLSKASKVPNWYDDKATDVGVYMGADALPVQLGYYRPVGYIRNNRSESFNVAPGYEMRDSRTYALVKESSNHSVIYVGKNGNPDNPAGRTPQVYIGVRNNGISKSTGYSSHARDLDNFIYQNRTIEFVPAGNYGLDKTNPGYLNSKAYAANAITVGAIEPFNNTVTNYTSTRVCADCSQKPEIYNYTHVMMDDLARTYTQTNNNKQYYYQPFYDGTEMAAAYTAGMVSNLLSVNPFYRWHPEVVKALLLTSNPLAFTSSTKKAPTYKYLVFDDIGAKPDYNYDSRFWNGSISKLRTRVNNRGKSEIWMVIENPGSASNPATAAIAWLSSGNDIANIGKIPQNFDLEVYGTNDDYYYLDDANVDLSVPYMSSSLNEPLSLNFNNPGVFIGGSYSTTNAFEKVSIASDYEYLVFKITLESEDSRSENKGEIVLGFNLTSSEYRRNR